VYHIDNLNNIATMFLLECSDNFYRSSAEVKYQYFIKQKIKDVSIIFVIIYENKTYFIIFKS